MAVNPETMTLFDSGVGYLNNGINNGEPDKATEYLNKAIECFNKAITLEPQIGQLYHVRGMAYKTKGNFDKALADFTEALRLNPNSAATYSERAQLYRGNGENDKAIADINQAITLDPNDPISFLIRGDIYAGKKDWDQAIADYETALGDENALRDPPSLLETAKESLAKAQKARAAAPQDGVTAGLSDSPRTTNDPKVLVAEGLRYQKEACSCADKPGSGNPQELHKKAAECFRIAAEMGEAEAQAELGSCYYYGWGMSRDSVEATKWYLQSAAQGNSAGMFRMGNYYCEIENWAKAIEWYSKAEEHGYPYTDTPLAYCKQQFAASGGL